MLEHTITNQQFKTAAGKMIKKFDTFSKVLDLLLENYDNQL